jgi:hypothetical protein
MVSLLVEDHGYNREELEGKDKHGRKLFKKNDLKDLLNKEESKTKSAGYWVILSLWGDMPSNDGK